MTRRYYTSPDLSLFDILVVLDNRYDPESRGPSIQGFRSSYLPQILGLPGARAPYFGIIPPDFFQRIGSGHLRWTEVDEAFIRRIFADQLGQLEANFKTEHKLGAPKGKLP